MHIDTHKKFGYSFPSDISDRRMLIRTLKECSMLQNIPLGNTILTSDYPKTPDAWKELELDVAASVPMELNGILLGATTSNEKEKRREGEKLLQLLPLLCNKLVQGLKPDENSPQKRITSDEIYHSLLVRLSSKRNASITFSQVNMFIGSKELVLQVPKKPIKPLRDSNLAVYISNNAVHAVVEHQYAIGLFRKSDSAGRPWIGLTASIRERVNLSTGQSVSRISLQIHEEKAAIY
jgi:hypothetical protein